MPVAPSAVRSGYPNRSLLTTRSLQSNEGSPRRGTIALLVGLRILSRRVGGDSSIGPAVHSPRLPTHCARHRSRGMADERM